MNKSPQKKVLTPKTWRQVVALLLCVVLFVTALPVWEVTAAPTRSIDVNRAVALAFAHDAKYQKTQNQIILKYAQYNQALATVKAKWKDFGTFRFSFLLNLKFPEKPYMNEEFDMITKGPDIMNEIIALRRQLVDIQFDVANKTRNAFDKAYLLTEQSVFTEKMVTASRQTLERNQRRLSTGSATQEDVDKIQKTLEAQEKDLATTKRELENAKSALSDLLGQDVNTDYRFVNPLESMKLEYYMRQSIINYTQANDVAINNQRDVTNSVLEDIKLMSRLYTGQYGGYMTDVMRYVNQVTSGQTVDYTSFKQVYDQMITNLEQPWGGSYRILFFIRIPREWFKGKLSGSRYIDDEQQALYIACMEYGDQQKQLALMLKEKSQEVSQQFENLVTMYNSIGVSRETVAREKAMLDKILNLNRRGQAEFSEVSDQQETYQQAQMDLLTSMADYTDFLNDFDKLTYGYVSRLRSGTSFAGDAGEGGVSNAGLDDLSRPYYFINVDIVDVKFTFSLHFPEDYAGDVDEYELWYEDQQIGSRQALDATITHMPLVYGDSYILRLRLYGGDEFIDEIPIDTNILRDYLEIKGSEPPPAPTRRLIGTYALEPIPALNMTKLTFQLRNSEGVTAFLLKDQQGKTLQFTEPRLLAEGITYLNFALQDLTAIQAEFYGEDDSKLYDGVFVPENKEVYALLTEGGG